MKALTRLGWILANTIGLDHDRIRLIWKFKKIKAKTSIRSENSKKSQIKQVQIFKPIQSFRLNWVGFWPTQSDWIMIESGWSENSKKSKLKQVRIFNLIGLDFGQHKSLTRLGWIESGWSNPIVLAKIRLDHDRIRLIQKFKKIKAKTSTRSENSKKSKLKQVQIFNPIQSFGSNLVSCSGEIQVIFFPTWLTWNSIEFIRTWFKPEFFRP